MYTSHLKKQLALILCILTAILLSIISFPCVTLADDEEWTQFQNDIVNSGKTGSHAPVDSRCVAWSAFTHYSSTHGIDVTPIIANGKVFVIDVLEYAWAFDVDTGNPEWSTQLETGTRFSMATPAYGEGKVFFATETGYIYALDENNGAILWSGKLTEGTGQLEELTTQLLYDEGRVYVGSWEGKYFCLDANGNGTEPQIVWTHDIEGKQYSWWSGPAIIGDHILFGDTNTVITCLDKTTGAPVDTLDLAALHKVDAGHIRSVVSTNTDNTRIYVSSRNGYIFATGFDPVTGHFVTTDKWYSSINSYSASSPVFHDGKVYVCSGSFYTAGALHCFDDTTGIEDWNYPFDSHGGESSPVISLQDDEPYIYMTTDTADGSVYCFDANGTLHWQYIPDHPEYMLQGVAIAGGKVFFGNDAGYLYALETCPDWDLNCDGIIDIFDVAIIGMHWDETGIAGWIPEDLNPDGVIDIFDVAVVGMHWDE